MLIDSDVLVQCSEEEIEKRMGNRQILLGVEKNQYPVKTKNNMSRYINSGVIVGNKHEFKKLYEDMKNMHYFPGCKLKNSNKTKICDQLCLQSVNEIHPRPLDWDSKIILNTYALDLSKMKFNNGKWSYKDNYPCFIHSNGYKWPMRMLCSKSRSNCHCHSNKFHFRV